MPSTSSPLAAVPEEVGDAPNVKVCLCKGGLDKQPHNARTVASMAKTLTMDRGKAGEVFIVLTGSRNSLFCRWLNVLYWERGFAENEAGGVLFHLE